MKDRSDNSLWEKIEALGIDIEIAGEAIYDMVQTCPSDTWNTSRMAVATEMSEFAQKIFLNEAYYISELNGLQENMNTFFRRKAKNLCPSDIEMIKNLPKKRYKLSAFNEYSKATMGLSKGFHLFGAEDNVGKTAILIQLACDILHTNEKSRVWYFTLDDTGKKLSKRFLASLTYYCSEMKIARTSKINFANSYYEDWEKTHSENLYNIKLEAHDLLRQYLGERRLMIIEGQHTEESIKTEMMGADPDNDILIIDAIYNLNVTAGKMSSDVQVDGIRANIPKRISNHFGIPVVCSKDARKGSKQGSDIDTDGTRIKCKLGSNDLAGSRLWKHEPDTIAMMWEQKYEVDSFGEKEIRKMAVMSMTKNKISEYSPVINYNFNGAKNTFQELGEYD